MFVFISSKYTNKCSFTNSASARISAMQAHPIFCSRLETNFKFSKSPTRQSSSALNLGKPFSILPFVFRGLDPGPGLLLWPIYFILFRILRFSLPRPRSHMLTLSLPLPRKGSQSRWRVFVPVLCRLVGRSLGRLGVIIWGWGGGGGGGREGLRRLVAGWNFVFWSHGIVEIGTNK